MNKNSLFGVVLILFGVYFIGASKVPTGTISLDQNDPVLGSVITFTSTTTNLPGWADPRIQVVCEQHEQIVYGEAGPSTQSFLIGGASSDWLWSANGADATQPATCVATLYFWQFHPVQVFRPLASLTFVAAGRQ